MALMGAPSGVLGNRCGGLVLGLACAAWCVAEEVKADPAPVAADVSPQSWVTVFADAGAGGY
jgi:hypothetical protein